MKLFFARFAVVYFALYGLPYALGLIPGTYYLKAKSFQFLKTAALWGGENILGLRALNAGFTGSGDTTIDYIIVALLLIVAFITACIGIFIPKTSWELPSFWVIQEILRLILGTILISYGLCKIIPPGQFPPLSEAKLLVPVGELSPMGMLWTFMASSRAYCYFSGIMEIVAGVLLFIPSLSVLGALLSLAIMANVFLLNLCYDVPVKLFSGHLVLISIFLLLPQLESLWQFFVLGTPSTLNAPVELFQDTRWNIIFVAVQVLILGGTFYSNIKGGLEYNKQFKENISGLKFYGAWKVVQNSNNSDLTQPWVRIAFDHRSRMYAFADDGHMVRFQATYIDDKNTVHLEGLDGHPTIKDFVYSLEPQGGKAVWTEVGDSSALTLHLERESKREFILLSRGFHWINEQPFNR